jgi:FkbM family methyltransferase
MLKSLRIRLKHGLARRKKYLTAKSESFAIHLDTWHTPDVGQILNLCKKIKRGEWEPGFLKACFEHIQPNETIFEIGTWIGPYSVILGKYVVPAGRVIGFEPDPVAFRQCVLNLDINQTKNVFVLPFALSDTTGSVALFTNRIFGNSGSSIIPSNPTRAGCQQEHIDVPCLTLDKFAEMTEMQPTTVKMDIEGAEDLAMAGGTKTLSRKNVKIYLEIHHEYLAKRGKDANIILKLLADMGKTIYFLEDDSAYPYKLNDKIDPSRPITIPNFHILAM